MFLLDGNYTNESNGVLERTGAMLWKLIYVDELHFKFSCQSQQVSVEFRELYPTSSLISVFSQLICSQANTSYD